MALQPEEQLVRDYFADPMSSPRLQVHHQWHHTHSQSQLNYGREFLLFHKQYIEKFDAFRALNGFLPLVGWDPATPIPASLPHEVPLSAARLTSDPSSVNPACRTPSWATVAGGTDFDPRFGYTNLCQFRSLDELGRSLDSGWHGRVHNTIGGDMSQFHSPIDPVFWPWHKWIDDIRVAWEACQLRLGPLHVASVVRTLFGVANDAPGVVLGPDGKPRPFPGGPEAPLWNLLSSPLRDAMLAHTVHELAGLLDNADVSRTLQQTVAALLPLRSARTMSIPRGVASAAPSMAILAPVTRFERVVQILDEAIGGPTSNIGVHGAFWRGLTRDQFVAKTVFGHSLVEVGNGPGSNLVKALKGEAPFGTDLPVPPPDADFSRMPAGLPPVSDANIAFIQKWIDDGCPNDALTTAPLVWRPTNAPAASSRTDDIWFLDPDVGWAVNSNGQIVKTTDGGATWQQQFHDESVYFRCIGFASPLRGWAGTLTGSKRLFDTRDGGTTWDQVNNLPTQAPSAICGLSVVNESVVYASGTNYPNRPPRVMKTVDGGATWTVWDMTPHASLLVDVYFTSPTRGWVVGGKSQPGVPPGPGLDRANIKPVVLLTEDGGATWVDRVAGIQNEFPLGEWGWKIQFLNDLMGFVSLENFSAGAILKTIDGGQTWTRHAVNDPQYNANLEGVGFADEKLGWVGGWGSADFTKGFSSETTDGGLTWKDANEIGAFINRFRFFGNPVSVGYASGRTVYKYSAEPVPPAVALTAPAPATRFLESSDPVECGRPVSIRVNMPVAANRLTLRIWDRFGEEVRTLVDEPRPAAGRRTFTWDVTNNQGEPLAQGSFILRVTVDDQSESRILGVGSSDIRSTEERGSMNMSKNKPASEKRDKLIYPLRTSGRESRGADAAKASQTGLQRFSFHSSDSAIPAAALLPPRTLTARGATPDLDDMSTETAALYYLEGGLASSELPTFTAEAVNGEKPDFQSLGTEKMPITDTQYVKFRQMYRKIPVYGSLVSVELDNANKLVSINSSMGTPANVDAAASVSPADAVAKVRELAGYGSQPLDVVPRLHYFFDRTQQRWRLVYILEDVLKYPSPNAGDVDIGETGHDPMPEVADFVIDAHNNELVAKINRVATAGVAVAERGKDALDNDRSFTAEKEGTNPNVVVRMINPHLGVSTHDFEFRSIQFQSNQLPGKFVTKPAAKWDANAISAHANAELVLKFLKDELSRNGVDNAGGTLKSSINCVQRPFTGNVWRNAAWFLGQMVYGQQKVGTVLRTFAVGLDVVAHEILHGVTDHTARLEYEAISGALNESYSDIFGAIISNYDQNDIAKWNWEMEDLSATGNPLRDLSRPSRFGQPEHMDDFLFADPPYDDTNDYGHVHTNSGIHNLAAFRLITAKGDNGAFLFDKRSAAGLFYIALTQQLSRTSTFSDSRRSVESAAKSLFGNDADGVKQAKIKAVSDAFESVGIPAA